MRAPHILLVVGVVVVLVVVFVCSFMTIGHMAIALTIHLLNNNNKSFGLGSTSFGLRVIATTTPKGLERGSLVEVDQHLVALGQR